MLRNIFRILLVLFISGCTIKGRDLEVTSEGQIVKARWVSNGLRVGATSPSCDDFRVKRIYYFSINENTRDGGDDLVREFIKAYNEQNETNFNAMIDYKKRSVFWGVGRPRDKGYLCGYITGILLEIE